jgi:import inner membrane translocase subunit TIM50
VKFTAIGIYKPPDVRAILKAYEGKNIPLEYAKKEAEMKREFIEEWKARGGGKVRLGKSDIL